MISVITPVYNASRFLNKTVESVLLQPEVSQHILIDDGSTDNSWELILKLQQKDKRIIALHHDDKKNHGRSATRNVGINAATKKYIAFLDADDFYLPNRFKNDLIILDKDNSVDGVYNAIGIHFYDDFGGEVVKEMNLTTMKERVNHENLFESMSPFGSKGHFSGDGLIIRKEIFSLVGLFNENLIVAEDTELWCKMALKIKLVGGIIDKPVAIRGVHGNNAFNKPDLYKESRLIMYQSLLEWSLKQEVPSERLNMIWEKRNYYFKINNPSRMGEIKLISQLMNDLLKNISLMQYGFFLFQPIKSMKYILNNSFK